MRTTLPKDPGPNRPWLLVDANGKVLGRMAVKIANLLRGRDQASFSPQVDTGAFVIVVNADKVKLTGNKEEQKIYHQFSGWPGGLKDFKASVVRARHPDRMVRLAVKGMLPRNTLSRQIIRRLKVYAGDVHPHEAQNPKKVE